MTARRVGALDVGSNTIHLLVGDVEGGHVAPVRRHVEMPRLGRAVDTTGEVGAELLERAAAMVAELCGEARDLGAETVLLGATAAVRRAGDRDAVLARLGEAAGTPCRLISERREGELAFSGAVAALEPEGTVLVADVGGGSTECVIGSAAEGPQRVASMPVGSGTATERWLPSDPPGDEELVRCREGLAALLREAVPVEAVASAIANGGTAASVSRLLPGRPEVLDAAMLGECRERLRGVQSAKVSRQFAVREARARVLPAGVEILDAVREHFSLTALTVTVFGLREGMALAWAERGEDWHR